MKRPKRDPFDALGELYGEKGMYLSRCGYLHADGGVSDFAPTTGWQHLHRAVASCFGSCARRMRGTWNASEPPIAALLAVVDWRGRYVWKQRINFPKEGV